MKLPPNWSWERLNECYIRESGMESKPFLSKEFAWANWSKHGFTEGELIQVLRYLRNQVKRNERKPACMLFRNLIEQPENFEQELSLSKEDKLRHKPPQNDRQSVLMATGRPTAPETPAKAVGSILEAEKAFAAFREWRKSNDML